jgi:hypothetical protein
MRNVPDTGHLALGVEFQRCANGETFEFFLTLGGERMRRRSVFRTLNEDDDVEVHALFALQELLYTPHTHTTVSRSGGHVSDAGKVQRR